MSSDEPTTVTMRELAIISYITGKPIHQVRAAAAGAGLKVDDDGRITLEPSARRRDRGR